MKWRSSSSTLYACVLGGINGLFVGLAVEALRFVNAKHEMQRLMEEAVQHESIVPYMLKPTMKPFIPMACIIAFAATSHLMHLYLIKRPRPLLLLWLLTGTIAMWAGYYMNPAGGDGFSLTYLVAFAISSVLVYWSWMNHRHSVPRLWLIIGITAVLLVAAIVQIIGLFMVQRYELRQPLTWLLCLALVAAINFIYGTVIRFVLPQYSLKNL